MKNKKMGLILVTSEDEKLVDFLLLFSLYELNILKHSPGGTFRRLIGNYIKQIDKENESIFLT